jgi:phosphoribosylformylglycinamidine cyclo-ligase
LVKVFYCKEVIKITIKNEKRNLSYKASGVDIENGKALVDRIKPLAETTDRPGVTGSIGGFGGLFDLKAAGFNDPILIAATDGVGTKLKIANEVGIHDTVGIDLVAMCVNDIVVQGGEPLFFLDYLATGKLDIKVATNVLKGIAKGCLQSGTALIGGETAEMPGMYTPGDYDLAGFGVGAVERTALLPRLDIEPHDIVLGLASNGLHSNGFSLVRNIIQKAGFDIDVPAPFDSARSLGEALLDPTKIYVKSSLASIKTGWVKGFAHITGGGLIENIPRILTKGLGVDLYSNAWDLPPVFQWIVKTGQISPLEMARTFNCGIGMVVITSPNHAADLQQVLQNHGEIAIPIGEIVKRQGEKIISIHNIEETWKATNEF